MNLNWNSLFTVGQLCFDFIDQVILAFGTILVFWKWFEIIPIKKACIVIDQKYQPIISKDTSFKAYYCVLCCQHLICHVRICDFWKDFSYHVVLYWIMSNEEHIDNTVVTDTIQEETEYIWLHIDLDNNQPASDETETNNNENMIFSNGEKSLPHHLLKATLPQILPMSQCTMDVLLWRKWLRSSTHHYLQAQLVNVCSVVGGWLCNRTGTVLNDDHFESCLLLKLNHKFNMVD